MTGTNLALPTYTEILCANILIPQSTRVLIAEDEHLISWSLSQALTKAGFEVTVTGCEGPVIDELQLGCFDLIITDLNLPLMNGVEFAAAMKERIPDIPVIVISSLDNRTFRELAPKARIDAFVEKPFDLNELVSLAGKFKRGTGGCGPS